MAVGRRTSWLLGVGELWILRFHRPELLHRVIGSLELPATRAIGRCLLEWEATGRSQVLESLTLPRPITSQTDTTICLAHCFLPSLPLPVISEHNVSATKNK